MVFRNGKMPFMNATAEIDKSGRLVVPKKLRDSLHLVAGTRVTLRIEGGEIVVAPETKPRGLSWKNGIPVFDTGPLPPGHENWVDEAREDRADELFNR
jgi:AbrB family looped-hinge helix DNA binding protein